MDLGRVDLNLLVAFEALMAERNVTQAARRLGIGQPAASDALRRLRLLFRDQLLVRAAGAMRPTPKALQVATGVRAALAQLRATLGDEVPFEPAATPLSFRLAATDYGAQVLLPPLVGRLRREAPGTDLQIVGYEKDTVGDLLARGEVDMVIGVFPEPPDHAVKGVLFEERFVGVARRGHPALAATGTPDLATYAGLPHALATVRQDRAGAVDRALACAGLERRIVLTLPHMLALPAVLAASDLVCALPSRVAARLDAAAVQTFELPVAISPWTVEMLWNPAARTDRASAWLRRCVQDVAHTI